VADYYHHPIGEVFATAQPRLLREGRDTGAPQPLWSVTAEGVAALQSAALACASKQKGLLDQLAAGPGDVEALDAALTDWRPLLRRLQEKGWVTMTLQAAPPDAGLVSLMLSAGAAEWAGAGQGGIQRNGRDL